MTALGFEVEAGNHFTGMWTPRAAPGLTVGWTVFIPTMVVSELACESPQWLKAMYSETQGIHQGRGAHRGIIQDNRIPLCCRSLAGTILETQLVSVHSKYGCEQKTLISDTIYRRAGVSRTREWAMRYRECHTCQHLFPLPIAVVCATYCNHHFSLCIQYLAARLVMPTMGHQEPKSRKSSQQRHKPVLAVGTLGDEPQHLCQRDG